MHFTKVDTVILDIIAQQELPREMRLLVQRERGAIESIYMMQATVLRAQQVTDVLQVPTQVPIQALLRDVQNTVSVLQVPRRLTMPFAQLVLIRLIGMLNLWLTVYHALPEAIVYQMEQDHRVVQPVITAHQEQDHPRNTLVLPVRSTLLAVALSHRVACAVV